MRSRSMSQATVLGARMCFAHSLLKKGILIAICLIVKKMTVTEFFSVTSLLHSVVEFLGVFVYYEM